MAYRLTDYGYVMLDVNNIKQSGARTDGTAQDNFTYIQSAIDNAFTQVTFGKAGETYIISQPLMLASDKTYVFDCEIKIKDSAESLLTVDGGIGDSAFTVADASGFAVGEYAGVTDDLQSPTYAQLRGHTGKIIDITGNVITLDSPSANLYQVTENAFMGNVQSNVIAYRKENIRIIGLGSLNNNRAGQSQIHPVWSAPQVEYQLAGMALCIYDCDNVEIDGVDLKNGNQHTLAVTGQGSGGYQNTDITVKNLTAENAHEKNILVRYITGGTFENLIVKDAYAEDGIIFYSGCNTITATNITATNNTRAGFFWNSESNSGLVASNITTSGNGWGLYIQAKNATISDVSCDDALLMTAGYTVTNVVLNNITWTNCASAKGYVIRISGGVNGVTFNNAIITGCSVIAIKCDSLVGGSDPVAVVFNNGGIYNHTGTKLSIEAGTDITYNNFVGTV